MAGLFDPLKVRSLTLRNRIGVSPMCQYSCDDGFATDWHLVHLGSRAVGGAALVIAEATAVEARGRISPNDLGIYRQEHLEMLGRIAHFIQSQGAVPGMQLAHSGRKGSTAPPWKGGKTVTAELGGWRPIGPSPLAFDETSQVPTEMRANDIADVRQAFVVAAGRALSAGFRWIELHAAHGYLLHSFLSPMSNRRTDQYGGSFDNRIRLTLEIAADLRKVWPDDLPLAVRISCTDWVEGGWNLPQSIELSRQLKSLGVDQIDCSSGGNVPSAKILTGPGYQVPFAEAIRRDATIATAAVGMITDAGQADAIIRAGQADMVYLARQMLRDPYWPRHAAGELDQRQALPPPVQYGRA